MAKLRQRLWQAVKEFADHTSVHGIHTSIRGNLLCRVVWSLIFIASFSMCMYLVGMAIMKFTAYEVVTSITLSNTPLPFPAVTICNLNPYKKSLFGNVTEFAYLESAMKSAANKATGLGQSKRRKREQDRRSEFIEQTENNPDIERTGNLELPTYILKNVWSPHQLHNYNNAFVRSTYVAVVNATPNTGIAEVSYSHSLPILEHGFRNDSRSGREKRNDPGDTSCDDLLFSWFTGSAPHNCEDIKLSDASAISGVYVVQMPNCNPTPYCCIEVYCDMESFGGGWLEIMRRTDGSTDFNRNWADYENGFGTPPSDYWLGNSYISSLTVSGTSHELLIELKPFELSCSLYARYSTFSVGAANTYYLLHVGGFTSPILVDSFSQQNNVPFSTYDQDRDTRGDNCAALYYGGWWHSVCFAAHLTGRYLFGGGCTTEVANEWAMINWASGSLYEPHKFSYKHAKMKIRPVNSVLNAVDSQGRYCASVSAPICTGNTGNICGYTEWSEWTDCIGATRSRTKSYIHPSGSTCYGGGVDPPAQTQTEGCSQTTCSGIALYGGVAPNNCAHIKINNPAATSGVYTLQVPNCPNPNHTPTCCVQVYCDMDSFGGGWMEFQRRLDGSVDFNRTYSDYVTGFGAAASEYWLGLSYLYALTKDSSFELLIELKPFETTCSGYARYNTFSIAGGSSQFKLTVSGYSGGSLADSFSLHNQANFATYETYPYCGVWNGGWWFVSCFSAYLNAPYPLNRTGGCEADYAKGLIMGQDFGYGYTFKESKMKIRPAGLSLNAADNGRYCTHFCLPLCSLSASNASVVNTENVGCSQDPTCTNIVLYGNAYPHDCEEIRMNDANAGSGAYMILMPYCTATPQCCVTVYCDMETFGGGWLSFQRRYDNSLSFAQTYDQYANGFGAATANFWLGNKYVYVLTNSKAYELLVELRPFELNCSTHARYSTFTIGNAASRFAISVSGFTSPTIGDSLKYHNNKGFQAIDDDTTSCVTAYGNGGWWFNACAVSNLNGPFSTGSTSCTGTYASFLFWGCNFNFKFSFTRVAMKIRPVGSPLAAADTTNRYCTSLTLPSCFINEALNPACSVTTDSCANLVLYGGVPPHNCEDIKQADAATVSGVYVIQITNCSLAPNCCVQVYCDMNSFGGGWLEFQRRINGSVSFNRNMSMYRSGFGNAAGEYWLGLDYLFAITSSATYELLIEFGHLELNCSTHGRYAMFSVGTATTYKLNVGGFSSPTVGDALNYHNGSAFTTPETGGCGSNAGWWWKTCWLSQLNSAYTGGGCGSTGMAWQCPFGTGYSFKYGSMKIRPSNSALDAPDGMNRYCTTLTMPLCGSIPSISSYCNMTLNTTTASTTTTSPSTTPHVYVACLDFTFAGGYVIYDNGTIDDRPEGAIALLFCNGSAIVIGSVFAECVSPGVWEYPSDPAQCQSIPAEVFAQLQAAQGEISQYFDNPQALQSLLQDYLSYMSAAIDETTLISMGQPFTEMVPGCTYNGRRCTSSDFTSYLDPGYGNCYQFNNDATMFSTAGYAGPTHGLSVNLFANQSEYTSLTDRAGLAVVLAGQQETVIADVMATIVPLGYETHMTATYATTQKLPWPYGDCVDKKRSDITFYYKTKYSQEGCLRSCYQKLLIDTCKCGDPRIPKPDDASYCTILQKTCVSNFAATNTMDVIAPKCYCPSACREIRYSTTITQSVWPSATAVPQTCRGLTTIDSLHCIENYRNNYGKVQIFLSKIAVESIVETPAYDAVCLLSDFGGLFGLYLGMSVISCAEFFALVGQMVRYALNRNMEVNDDDDEPPAPRVPSNMCF